MPTGNGWDQSVTIDSHWITQEADFGLRIRLQKSSKCIHLICPYLSYGQNYGKNLKDTDMSTKCRWWTCCYSKATRSFRYTAPLIGINRAQAPRLEIGKKQTCADANPAYGRKRWTTGSRYRTSWSIFGNQKIRQQDYLQISCKAFWR